MLGAPIKTGGNWKIFAGHISIISSEHSPQKQMMHIRPLRSRFRATWIPKCPTCHCQFITETNQRIVERLVFSHRVAPGSAFWAQSHSPLHHHSFRDLTTPNTSHSLKIRKKKPTQKESSHTAPSTTCSLLDTHFATLINPSIFLRNSVLIKNPHCLTVLTYSEPCTERSGPPHPNFTNLWPSQTDIPRHIFAMVLYVFTVLPRKFKAAINLPSMSSSQTLVHCGCAFAAVGGEAVWEREVGTASLLWRLGPIPLVLGRASSWRPSLWSCFSKLLRFELCRRLDLRPFHFWLYGFVNVPALDPPLLRDNSIKLFDGMPTLT